MRESANARALVRGTLIEYRVKPGRGEENEAAIGAVFEELRRKAPAGLRYASFKRDDGLSFVHLVSAESADSPLVAIDAFQRFVATVRERCEAGPVNHELTEIGSYRVFE